MFLFRFISDKWETMVWLWALGGTRLEQVQESLRNIIYLFIYLFSKKDIIVNNLCHVGCIIITI